MAPRGAPSPRWRRRSADIVYGAGFPCRPAPRTRLAGGTRATGSIFYRPAFRSACKPVASGPREIRRARRDGWRARKTRTARRATVGYFDASVALKPIAARASAGRRTRKARLSGNKHRVRAAKGPPAAPTRSWRCERKAPARRRASPLGIVRQLVDHRRRPCSATASSTLSPATAAGKSRVFQATTTRAAHHPNGRAARAPPARARASGRPSSAALRSARDRLDAAAATAARAARAVWSAASRRASAASLVVLAWAVFCFFVKLISRAMRRSSPVASPRHHEAPASTSRAPATPVRGTRAVARKSGAGGPPPWLHCW